MSDVLRNEIKKYIKETKSLLFCDSKTLKSFLKDFENDVVDFADDNGVADIQQIIEHFGTPDQVARGFFETTNLRKIKKRLQIKQYILCGVISALLIWAVCLTFLAVDGHNEHSGTFVDSTNNAIIIHTVHVKK
ncbi:MAG: hypothetical protein J1F23_05270 [Oscillospiraceae bacterium]|nr:hypothetical protein [Oscillospiraceae bacterium]